MSAKKMGRPTENPKDIQFRVRMDSETDEKLKVCSEKLKITKSDVIRKGIDRIYDDLEK